MAEGGFEFTVSVPVEADLSRFRQQLGAELDSVQRTPATVPVQSATAGSALAVRPATAGVAPAAPTLAAATNAAVAQAAAGSVQSAYGGLAPNAAIARAAVEAGVPAVVNSGTGQVVVGGAGLGGGADFVPVPSSLRGRGPGRGGIGGLGIVGWGTALHAAGNVALAHMEHSRAVREADGSAAGLIAADIAYQTRAAGAIPIVGQMALAVREAVTGDIEYTQGTLRAAETADRVTGARRDTAFTRRGLLAGQGYEADIERARVESQRTISSLTDERGRIASELRNLPGQVSSVEYANVQAKRGELRRIDEQIGLAGETFSVAESRFRRQQGLERMSIGARTAEFLDAGSGLNPSDAERRAIVRRHQIEVKQSSQENPSLLPDIVRSHSAELFAFDRGRERANELRDVQSAGTVRYLDLAGQGRDFDAERARQLGGYQTRMTAARGDPREMARIAREGEAAAGALTAEQGRRDEAAQFLLNRDPLGAAMTMERDPMRRKVLAQQNFDNEQLRSAALRNRAEVTGMEAGGQEKSAQGLEIQRRAELEQDAAHRAGYSRGDQASILQSGLNELQAYQRQLRRMAELGSVGETAAGGYAPSTGGRRDSSEPVVEAIRNLQTSIDQMTNELRSLTSGTN